MKALHWSDLKYMADCPAVYKYRRDNGVAVTAAMRFGSLVHLIVLGKSIKDFAVYEGDRRGKAWTDFKEAHPDVEIYTQDEWDRAEECAKAVLADPICGTLVRSGIKEHQIEWDLGGRACAGTPDINGDILLDLKVTPMAAPHRIEWHARKMLWHAQLAWYKHGIEKKGVVIENVYLLAVTPKPPYLPVAYRLSQDTLDYGMNQWWALFERLRMCEVSNEWPGYAQAILPLDIQERELSLIIDGEDFEL